MHDFEVVHIEECCWETFCMSTTSTYGSEHIPGPVHTHEIQSGNLNVNSIETIQHILQLERNRIFTDKNCSTYQK